MKKIIIAIAAALSIAGASQSAHAIECSQVYQMAHDIMMARQSGASLPDVLAVVGSRQVLVAIARDAYNQPRMNTPTYQARSVGDFADKWFNLCLADPAGAAGL